MGMQRHLTGSFYFGNEASASAKSWSGRCVKIQQQLLEGKPGENKQPGWISAQLKLTPCLEEVTAAQEMGENSRELFSTRL